VDTQESGKRELFSSYFQPEKPQNLRYIAIAIKSEVLNIERSHFLWLSARSPDYVSRREKSDHFPNSSGLDGDRPLLIGLEAIAMSDGMRSHS
jgi:hypothetical protein